MSDALRMEGIRRLQLLGLSAVAATEIADLDIGKLSVLVDVMCELTTALETPVEPARRELPSQLVLAPYEGGAIDGIGEEDLGRAYAVKSSCTGVFYRAHAPNAESLADVDDILEPGAGFGLIEAMKVFSPLALEGAENMRVLRFLVDNGKLVKEGQPLILLVPA